MINTKTAELSTGNIILRSAAVLAAATLLPLLFHAVPPYHGVSWGMRFLPMFYAPLTASLVWGPLAGVAGGILCPLAYGLLTGFPAAAMVGPLTFEIAALGLYAGSLRPRAGRYFWTLPPAFLLIRASSLLLFGGPSRVFGGLAETVALSWPGLAMLAFIALLSTLRRR